MTNKSNRVLYVGSTTNLYRRTKEHKSKFYPKSFTARYNCNKLVYYRAYECIYDAASEEKRLKGGSRKQKLDLVNAENPDWRDLWEVVEKW